MLTLPKATVKMTRITLIALSVFALVALISVLPSTPQASAQERTVSDGLTLIALDTTMTRLRDLEAAQMAATLVLSQTPRGLIAIGEYGASPDDPRTFSTTDEAQQEVRNVIRLMRDAIDQPSEGDPPAAAFTTMLTRYASYMQQINAPPGSKLVLLSAGAFADPENTTPATVAVLADGFTSGGILIDGVSLATTSAPDRAVIETVANESGGRYFDLGFNDGVLEFLNATLGVGLRETFRGEPQGSTPLVSSLDVLPHSTTLVAGFVYEGGEIAATLISPSGQRLTAGSTTVDVLAASGINVFTVLDPEPGRWGMESLGGSGSVLFVTEVLNPIVLGPPEMPPAPVGFEWPMFAMSTSDGAPHIDTTASLVAEITGPGGATRIFQMYDDGMGNDRLANDGVYVADIEADDVPGIRDVHFRMTWPVTPAIVEGTSTFSLEVFPQATISATSAEFGMGGEGLTLATIDVTLDGVPFPVDIAALNVAVTDGATGDAVAYEVLPSDEEDSPASYRIVADVLESATFDFTASLNLVYMERDYSYDIGAATLSAELDPPPEPNRLPLVFAGVLLVGLAGGAVAWWFLLRTTPMGYIYKVDLDSPQELVVDFSETQFALLDLVFRSNVVPAVALAALPLRGGRFVFSRGGVSFRYNPERDGDVRMTIDGEPVVAGRNDLVDGSEMTVAGVSYKFSVEKFMGDIRVSTLLRPEETEDHDELSRFTNDPMTFDAPSSIRPTRRS